MVDFVRGLVHKIERENDEMRTYINKKDTLYLLNKSEEDPYFKSLGEKK